MSVLAQPRTPSVRHDESPGRVHRVGPGIESRPPSVGWQRPPTTVGWPDQPPLDLVPVEPGPVPGPRSGTGSRRQVVKARWTARPRPDLPDAAEWGASLAGAVMQAWLGQRSLTQLNRWLAEDVLVAISMRQHQLRRRAGAQQLVIPVSVRSVRVQHPHPEVAEVAAHLIVQRRSAAMALRLEAFGDRWLGTALELGPRN